MKVIVTGGAGFIGSHLCDALIAKRCEVICIDNLLSGKYKNIAHLTSNRYFDFLQADIRSEDLLDLDFYNVDAIFHLAASKKNICLTDPQRDLQINAGGTLNMLKMAEKYKIHKFIHASTGSVYGNVDPQTEASQTIPVSYYGVSKLAGESYVRMSDLDYNILRYFHVYGPRQESSDKLGGVIAIFLRRIYQGLPLIVYGDGTQTRCFTYVKDIVNANSVMLDNKTDNHLFNCVSDIYITLNYLIRLLFERTHIEVPVIYKDWQVGDIKDFNPTNDRIKQFINFTSFDDGLQETINESCSLYR